MFGKVTSSTNVELLGTVNYKGPLSPVVCPDGSLALGWTVASFDHGLPATQHGDNCPI
jgi:hypothetical protein